MSIREFGSKIYKNKTRRERILAEQCLAMHTGYPFHYIGLQFSFVHAGTPIHLFLEVLWS